VRKDAASLEGTVAKGKGPGGMRSLLDVLAVCSEPEGKKKRGRGRVLSPTSYQEGEKLEQIDGLTPFVSVRPHSNDFPMEKKRKRRGGKKRLERAGIYEKRRKKERKGWTTSYLPSRQVSEHDRLIIEKRRKKRGEEREKKNNGGVGEKKRKATVQPSWP